MEMTSIEMFVSVLWGQQEVLVNSLAVLSSTSVYGFHPYCNSRYMEFIC